MRIVGRVSGSGEVSGHDPLGYDDVDELEVVHPSGLETRLDLLHLSFLHVRDLSISNTIPENKDSKLIIRIYWQIFHHTCT